MSNEADAGPDPALLDRHLRSRIAGLRGPLRIERVPGGRSNPTYFLNYDNKELVLRKQPSGELLESAHAVDREFRIMRALDGSGTPVPKVHFLEEDRSIAGTPFYVMDRVRGRVFDDPTFPSASSDDRRRMFLSSAEVLGRLHDVPWASLRLSGFGREGNYYSRQVSRWSRQWIKSRTRDIPDVDALAAWLDANVPVATTAGIVHGDFRPNNLIFHPEEPRVVAVLDWELSTIGHPLADVAYFALLWKLTSAESLGFKDHDLPGLGIPGEDEWLDHYTRFAPTDEKPLVFHTVFALFRLAVIAEGVAHRASLGSATSADAAQFGRLSAVFGRRGAEFLEHA